MQPLPSTRVGQIAIHRHPLEVGTSRLMATTRRLIQRCRVALIRMDRIDPECKEPLDAAWLQSFRLASEAHMAMLKEQRMRAQLVEGKAPELSEEEYRRELDLLARDAVLVLPREQLDEWLAERDARDRDVVRRADKP